MDLRVVLVRPRTPGNIGSAARAMKNFGIKELALVDPRLHRATDTPGEEHRFETESRRMAWHASDILDSSRTFATLKEAVSDCVLVLATAPQPVSRIRTLCPEEAASLLAQDPDGAPRAIVFGSESSGLTNDEAALCSGVVVIPTDPSYSDLNLAQSVAVVSYLCYRAKRESAGLESEPAIALASHEFVEETAETMLEVARRASFLKQGGLPAERELRHLLHRAGLSRREAEMFRSFWTRILACLPPKPGH